MKPTADGESVFVQSESASRDVVSLAKRNSPVSSAEEKADGAGGDAES